MPILMRQSHRDDYDTLIETLSPEHKGAIAFARFADGEAACIWGRKHRAKSDGWWWDGQQRELSTRLLEALRCDLPGWHLGITAEEHHPQDHRRLLAEARIGRSFITLAEVFIFANYARFRELNLEHCCTIGSHGEIDTPGDPNDPAWTATIDELVPFMIECSRPILVNAGPWACVLIHEYWKRCPKHLKQVALDVGSAMDERVKGRRSRAYQLPGSGLNSWVPKWKV